MNLNALPVDNRFLDKIAPTPLVNVQLDKEMPGIWCKLEFLNPSGSTKDRIARYMLEKAWRRGELSEGNLVVEASSGSTSIALALACAQLSLRFIAVMPEGVSRERLLMIQALGGETVLTPAQNGMPGALAEAERLADDEGAFYTRQFENPDNAEAHRLGTGPEVLAQIPGGVVDAVVSGVGTGGTIVGLQRAFEEAGCNCRALVARPVQGTALAEVECCSFSCRVPGVMDGLSKLYDEARGEDWTEFDVPDDAALETTRRLQQKGFPVGPSSGLNYAAALVAAKELPEGASVVTVFPDRMERYFSTELFSETEAAGGGGESGAR